MTNSKVKVPLSGPLVFANLPISTIIKLNLTYKNLKAMNDETVIINYKPYIQVPTLIEPDIQEDMRYVRLQTKIQLVMSCLCRSSRHISILPPNMSNMYTLLRLT